MVFAINLFNFPQNSLTTPAYFLVIHGSRNSETLMAASQLKLLLTEKMKLRTAVELSCLEGNLASFNSENIRLLDYPQAPLIEIAALELAPLPLNQSLVNFARRASSLGFSQIKVVPLFLAPGVHVTEDIPSEISLAIKQINNLVTIELSTFLGKYSEMARLLTKKFFNLSAQERILIAHGSRLSSVASYYQNLADTANAVMAYWSIAPSLEQQVEALVEAGRTQIAILPYFLFPGKITQAIAAKVASLQAKYPQVELFLGQPLGATEEIAELIAREI